jgi:phosphate/phosphite/phosphonate ABC transporter binding protein
MHSGRHPGPVSRLRFGATLTDSSTRVHLEAFCSALGDASGFEVTPVGVWYYERLLEALEVGDVDVAWLPPILAAQASSDGLAVPIALPVRGGVSSYSTALFVAETSPLRRITDIESVRAAWVDRQSVSGYLLIRAHLRSRGVDLDRAFTDNRFMGSHDAVAKAVFDGAADIGATFAYFDAERSIPVRAGWGTAKMRVIAHAGPIPADVIAARAHLRPEDVRAMQKLLLLQGHAKLREASTALLGTDIFTPPNPGHIGALAALLPNFDECSQPRRTHWPRG